MSIRESQEMFAFRVVSQLGDLNLSRERHRLNGEGMGCLMRIIHTHETCTHTYTHLHTHFYGCGHIHTHTTYKQHHQLTLAEKSPLPFALMLYTIPCVVRTKQFLSEATISLAPRSTKRLDILDPLRDGSFLPLPQ